ncbi:hypothetical protein DLAC_02096 [Tieghemostelium lacteum]|uniref:Uncharacterized protein n=1 Tax=Tieghemostelium lacteum TaxID=361077 RepID=A0A152A4K9_TIELA|nr:hypothetical protein DLAC_02096 [Tieghemostelium lacteum]|eukprot:KYR01015.1 hypothetical protein DLAC_02096 [Tieghemostelium lacteum]
MEIENGVKLFLKSKHFLEDITQGYKGTISEIELSIIRKSRDSYLNNEQDYFQKKRKLSSFINRVGQSQQDTQDQLDESKKRFRECSVSLDDILQSQSYSNRQYTNKNNLIEAVELDKSQSLEICNSNYFKLHVKSDQHLYDQLNQYYIDKDNTKTEKEGETEERETEEGNEKKNSLPQNVENEIVYNYGNRECINLFPYSQKSMLIEFDNDTGEEESNKEISYLKKNNIPLNVHLKNIYKNNKRQLSKEEMEQKEKEKQEIQEKELKEKQDKKKAKKKKFHKFMR